MLSEVVNQLISGVERRSNWRPFAHGLPNLPRITSRRLDVHPALVQILGCLAGPDFAFAITRLADTVHPKTLRTSLDTARRDEGDGGESQPQALLRREAEQRVGKPSARRATWFAATA